MISLFQLRQADQMTYTLQRDWIRGQKPSACLAILQSSGQNLRPPLLQLYQMWMPSFASDFHCTLKDTSGSCMPPLVFADWQSLLSTPWTLNIFRSLTRGRPTSVSSTLFANYLP